MRHPEIRLHIFGDIVGVRREIVGELRTAAAAQAGVSSRHRDLSLVLDRALETGGAVLALPDLRALLAVVEERGDERGGVEDLARLARRALSR